MTIARFALMPDIVSLRDAMDRFGTLAVPVDLWETKDAYHLRAALPGVRPDELEINATSDSISFSLPVAIDPSKVEATFENGVLSLVLPKAESTKPRTIKVNATNANSK